LNLIKAIGQALRIERTLFARRQRVAILIRPAHDLNVRLHSEPGGIDHSQPQFSTVTLAKSLRGAKDKNHGEFLHEMADLY
jgi:hypothetical protein